MDSITISVENQDYLKLKLKKLERLSALLVRWHLLYLNASNIVNVLASEIATVRPAIQRRKTIVFSIFVRILK